MVKASFAYPDVDVTLGDVIAILGSDADEVYATIFWSEVIGKHASCQECKSPHGCTHYPAITCTAGRIDKCCKRLRSEPNFMGQYATIVHQELHKIAA